MKLDLPNITAFVTVARAGGFREGARISGGRASRLSDQVRRLEAELGVRLFNRSTRSVALTEAGQGLLNRLSPALDEMELALDVVNSYRNRPAGTLKPPRRLSRNRPLNPVRFRKISIAASSGVYEAARAWGAPVMAARSGLKRASRTS